MIRLSTRAGSGGSGPTTGLWPGSGPTLVIPDATYAMDGSEATMEFTNTAVPTVVVTCPALGALTDGQIFVFKTVPGVVLQINSIGVPIDGTAAVILGTTGSVPGDRATLTIQFIQDNTTYIVLSKYPYLRLFNGQFNTTLTGALTVPVTGLVAKPTYVGITPENDSAGTALVGNSVFGYFLVYGPGGQFVIHFNDAPGAGLPFTISYVYTIQ